MPHSETIIDGQSCPSVTEVIGILDKSFLAFWRGKIGNAEADRISKSSSELGGKVHKHIEHYLITGAVEDAGVKDLGLFKQWLQWWEGQKYSVINQELKVISKKHKFGGTFDALLERPNGKKVLVDWKISKSDDHYRYLQLAGYAIALLEQTGEKVTEGLIVRVNPETGKVTEVLIKNLWKYAKLFLYCRKLYDFVKKGKKSNA